MLKLKFKGPKPLLNAWDQLKGQLKGKHIALFLDYDGTLSPIAKRPQDAVLKEQTFNLLNSLGHDPGCDLAIVTGRSLKDIKGLIGLENIIYVGNHGFEIEGPQIKFQGAVFPAVRALGEALVSQFKDMPGILVEDKVLTVCVHYRLLEASKIPQFRRIFTKIIQPYAAKKEIKIVEGKKTYDIRPMIAWNKGKAVSWLLRNNKDRGKGREEIAIYIGDDNTDEDAFKELNEIDAHALTIRVEFKASSNARYFVQDTDEVIHYLQQIHELMRPR